MSQPIKLGLLGNNLGRSRAKHLHELLGEMHGLGVTYEPMDLLERTEPVSIAAELERCRGEGFHGVNVTHPYKRDAFGHVQTVPGFPKGLTSVNTVMFAETGHGDCFCFDVKPKRAEHPVVLYEHDYHRFEQYAPSFAACIRRFAGG